MLRLVVLDIDNTLVRTPIDWAKLRRDIESATGVYVEHRPLIEGVYLYLSPEQRGVALRLIEEAELNSAAAVKPSEPLVELISNLKRCGCLVAVVTLRERRSAEAVLGSLGVARLVDHLVTRDDTMDRPRQVELVLRKLGIRGRDAVFVGDSPEDLGVLLRHGVSTVILREPRAYGVPGELTEVLARISMVCCS